MCNFDRFWKTWITFLSRPTETNSSGHHLASFCGMASLKPSRKHCTTSITIQGWWSIRHFSSSRRLKSIPLVWRSSDFSFRAIMVIIFTKTINDIPCYFFENDVLPALRWKQYWKKRKINIVHLLMFLKKVRWCLINE